MQLSIVIFIFDDLIKVLYYNMPVKTSGKIRTLNSSLNLINKFLNIKLKIREFTFNSFIEYLKSFYHALMPLNENQIFIGTKYTENHTHNVRSLNKL